MAANRRRCGWLGSQSLVEAKTDIEQLLHCWTEARTCLCLNCLSAAARAAACEAHTEATVLAAQEVPLQMHLTICLERCWYCLGEATGTAGGITTAEEDSVSETGGNVDMLQEQILWRLLS